MAIRYTQAKWTAKEMLALPEWDGQRDTARRVEKYLKRPDYDPKNATIPNGWATVVVDGVESRINGNTRAYVINHGRDPRLTINVVTGDRYHCSTKDEAQIVYNSIDNTSSSKGAQDKLTSALKACGVGVRSKMYKTGRGTSGLALAWRALRGQVSNSAWWRTEDMVKEFAHEIKLLDKLMAENNVPASSDVVSAPGFQMGVLLSLYRARLTPHRRGDGGSVDEVYKFWDDVIKHEGAVAAHSGLGSSSPAIKMWTTVKDHVKTASGKKTQSRERWYEIGAKVLSIFLRRDEEDIQSVSRKLTVIKEFFPCFVEDDQAEAA
jgi:hypothetical protein